MAASYTGNFVSQSEVDSRRKARKEQRRIERNVILKEAKESYKKAARREEHRRRTGEDSFILPGVAEQLRLGESEGVSASLMKKQQKHKKHKKESKKKKRKLSSSASASEHSSSEEIWVERDVPSTTKGSGVPGPAGPRQSWMELPGVTELQRGVADTEEGVPKKEEEEEGEGLLQSIIHRSSVRVKDVERKKKAEEKEALMCIDKPGAHPKELNPYWREGGRGLPGTSLEEHQANDQEGGSVRDGGRERGNGVVGDGGRSWLLKSYKRALEQSESEGRSFEDIAQERWGSIEELHSLLTKAGVDPRNPHRALAELSNPARQFRGRGEGGREHHRSGTSRDERYQDLSFNQPRKGHSFHLPGDGTEQRTSKHFAGLSSEPIGASQVNWRRPTSREVSTGKGQTDPDSTPPTSTVSLPNAVNTDATHRLQAEQRPPSHGARQANRHSEHRRVPPTAPVEEDRGLKSETVTDTQLNALGAKLMKAELMGNATKVATLKRELERLRALKEKQEEAPREPMDTTLVLTERDARGNVRPLKPPSEPRPSGGRKGKRKEYLREGEGLSVQDMLWQERTSTAEETHRMIAKMATKFVPSSQAGEVVDDALDSKSARSYNEQKEEDGRRKDAILQSKKMAAAVDNCHFCFGGKQFKKNLLISVGEKAYIALPAHQSLTEGHCFIVPQSHARCSTSLDEDVWAEMQLFRKSLTRMFADRGLDTVFLECFRNSRRHAHMSLECVPLPLDVGQLAPMYFKKAILESDEEWAQNKKLVDTKKKGIRGSIPNGLPYFAVEFGMEGGFAHVIEDESLFPWYFGHEVIGGMLDLEPRMWRKPPSEPFEQQKRKVLQFAEWWKAFDCTGQ